MSWMSSNDHEVLHQITTSTSVDQHLDFAGLDMQSSTCYRSKLGWTISCISAAACKLLRYLHDNHKLI